MFNDMVKDIGQYNAIWTLIRKNGFTRFSYILKCEHSCNNVKTSEETVLSHGRSVKCFIMFDEHLKFSGKM